MTYKFEEHNVTITSTNVELVSVTFNLKSEITTAEIILNTSESSYGTFISSNIQPESWTTNALQTWVAETLKQYEI